MPYKSEKIKLPEQFDRRIKLTANDKKEIKRLYTQENKGIRWLGRLYGVNKRSIQFILFPERQKKNYEARQLRGGWRQYYKKEKQRVAIASTRNYKQSLYLQGKIKLSTENS